MRIVITGSHGTGKTTLGKNLFRYLQEEKMKIGVTGSHGTGKTTLSKLLAGKNNWRYLPESPLQAMTKGFPINEETPIETEIWIFAKQIEMETSMHWIIPVLKFLVVLLNIRICSLR